MITLQKGLLVLLAILGLLVTELTKMSKVSQKFAKEMHESCGHFAALLTDCKRPANSLSCRFIDALCLSVFRCKHFKTRHKRLSGRLARVSLNWRPFKAISHSLLVPCDANDKWTSELPYRNPKRLPRQSVDCLGIFCGIAE